jgi:hypothetical protein
MMNGHEVTDVDVEGYVSYVYIIEHIATGKKYIGKKNLTRMITRPPLKGRKRKRKSIVPSEWREYWGSSPSLQADVEQFGQEAFRRTIIRLCKSKGEASYFESKAQFDSDCLLYPSLFYNGIINCRINAAHLKGLRNDGG